MGETWPIEQTGLADYLRADELHLAFNFRFVLAHYMASRYRDAIMTTHRTFGANAWPTWTLSNHDFARHITRFARGGDGARRARVAATMIMTLRGTPFIYYGEEIGMPDVKVPAERKRDPVGRDGCRTPMQWSEAVNGGFSTADNTWLPCGDFAAVNVERQLDDDHSMLSLYRRLIRLRREQSALREGTFRLATGDGIPEDCLVFHRETAGQHLVVALNFTDEAREITVAGRVIFASNLNRIDEMRTGTTRLEGDEALVIELS